MLQLEFQNLSTLASRHIRATRCLPAFLLLLLSGCAGYHPPASIAQPAMALSATTFDFKTVVLGQTLHHTLHISNTGSAPLRITSLSLKDKEFVITGPSVPRVVLPKMGLDYTLSFTPTTAGNASAALKIVSNAVNSVASVSLTGIGEKVLATVQISPAALNFGNLKLQTTSTKNVTLQNSGDINITISGITVVGAGFGYSNLSPGFSLAPNQSVTFQVWFRPQVKGSAAATVSILSANLASPATMSLAGDGVTTPPPASQHSVHLTWNPSSSVVAGYRVYRSLSPNNGLQLISSLLPSTAYDDATVVSGTTYYYAVTAVDPSGVESSDSNEATAAVPNP